LRLKATSKKAVPIAAKGISGLKDDAISLYRPRQQDVWI
jgi:hypothetical protein